MLQVITHLDPEFGRETSHYLYENDAFQAFFISIHQKRFVCTQMQGILQLEISESQR